MLWKIISESEAERWNSFISTSPGNSILQSYEWGEVKKGSGWEPIRIIVEEKEEIVAAASILKRTVPYFKKSLFYAPRGPIVDFRNETVLETLLQAVKEQALLHNAIVFKADPLVQEKDVGATVMLKKKGFHFVNPQIQPRVTYFLDLTQDLEALLAGFEEKTRYNIRLSGRKGVTVREMSSEEGVKLFYGLYEETAKRDNFMVHPLGYYQRIRELLLQKGMGAIFIAFYEEKPIAAVYNFCFGPTVWYLYGASSAEHRNLMPNHALHWHFIQWAKEKGYKTYDLWGIPAHPHEKHPLWGVYRFKKGFNGQEIRLVGMCDLALKPFWYHLTAKGLGFYQNLRSLIVKGKISNSLAE